MEREPDSPVQPGQVWLRKRGSAALVRRVLRVEAGKVHFQVLYGPARCLREPHGFCQLRSFLRHSQQIEEQEHYAHLDGARRFRTFLVLGTQGTPLFRCSEKRAQFYLKKGYVRTIEEGVLQFTDDTTEKTLAALYDGKFSEFFMAVKNDRCVSCGRPDRLSRHHLVPQRHKARVPLPWRNCLSNVLFLCMDCHERYESCPEPQPDTQDWRAYVLGWKEHFLREMQPRFLPPGWDIISVTNPQALDRSSASEPEIED